MQRSWDIHNLSWIWKVGIQDIYYCKNSFQTCVNFFENLQPWISISISCEVCYRLGAFEFVKWNNCPIMRLSHIKKIITLEHMEDLWLHLHSDIYTHHLTVFYWGIGMVVAWIVLNKPGCYSVQLEILVF